MVDIIVKLKQMDHIANKVFGDKMRGETMSGHAKRGYNKFIEGQAGKRINLIGKHKDLLV